jgi:hypothetical protein
MQLQEEHIANIKDVLDSTSGNLVKDGEGYLCTFSGFSAEGRALHAKRVLTKGYSFTVGDLLEDKNKGRVWDRAFRITP